MFVDKHADIQSPRITVHYLGWPDSQKFYFRNPISLRYSVNERVVPSVLADVVRDIQIPLDIIG
jgi:hypothetical protein